MPTAVSCPNCRARFEIASDLAADAPIRCKECVHMFLRGDSAAAGIQAGPAPLKVAPMDDDDRRDEVPSPPRRPAPRPPIPMVSFLWIALGVLFFLLMISLGFNVWVLIGHPERFNRFDEEMRAERAAMAAQQMAEQARLDAQMQAERAMAAQKMAERAHHEALQMEMQAKDKVKELQKQQEEAARKLKQTEELLDDALRRLKKDPEKEGALPRVRDRSYWQASAWDDRTPTNRSAHGGA